MVIPEKSYIFATQNQIIVELKNNGMNDIESSTGEIVMYQPDETIRLEVRVENETVWLTQQQMADLFMTTRNNVTLHIGNIFKEGELVETSVRKDSLLTASDDERILFTTRSHQSIHIFKYSNRTLRFLKRG